MSLLKNKPQLLGWLCRLTGIVIMGQTLFFKFSAAPESIYIFTKVGMEPWGRWITGTVELTASLMLLWNPLAWLGSFLAAMVMFGAIFSHLTLLGIVVQDDGGLLFSLACIVFITALTNLYVVRAQIPWVGQLLVSETAAEFVAKFKLLNIRLGYLFLGVCVSIALIGVAQEVYTISKISSITGAPLPEVRSVTQVAYFLTIAGVFISFVLAMALLRMIGKPISDFTIVCKQVILGEQNARVHIQNGAELGVMAKSFNQMLDDLQRKDANIRSLLGGITDGVFFFDQNGKLSQERSKATSVIFPDLAGMSTILEFFENYLGQKPNSMQKVLGFFWDQNNSLGFSSIAELLPKKGQINNAKDAGHPRFISLKYRAETTPDDKLLRVIVIATDRTEEELAAREGLVQREKVARLSLISSSIADFQASLDEINTLWEQIWKTFSSFKTPEHHLDENAFLRIVHSLKGGLAAYEFKVLSTQVHQIESELAGKKVSELLLSLEQKFQSIEAQFRQSLAEIESVFALKEEKNWIRISATKLKNLETALQKKSDPELNSTFNNLQEQGLGQLLVKYERYLTALSEQDGSKVVRLQVAPESIEVNPSLVLSLANCLGHLFRNCFDHGIESTSEREAAGKPPEGTITIKALLTKNGMLTIQLRDDGQGIQATRLVDKAIKLGFWSKEQASQATENQKLDLIFASGLSTKDAITETSGRGVGMDAVKAELESRGGHIGVQSWPSRGTEFSINVPLNKAEAKR